MTQHFEQRTEESFDGWLTPEWVLDLVREFGPIGLDPCSEECNPAKAASFFSIGGLVHSWDEFPVPGSATSVYVNPPYGRALGKWAGKVVAENLLSPGRNMFVLSPARTETDWFGHLFDTANAVAFFRKRIKFHHPSQPGKQSPKFPNVMFYFGGDTHRFKHVFDEAARVVLL